MAIRPTLALTLILATGIAACAPQPSGTSATTRQATPRVAGTSPAAQASSMPGMSAAEHQRMLQGDQPAQGMQGMSAEEHQRMMQSR